jgi:hypothetical protein
MSWQRLQKTVMYVMAPYTEGERYTTFDQFCRFNWGGEVAQPDGAARFIED